MSTCYWNYQDHDRRKYLVTAIVRSWQKRHSCISSRVWGLRELWTAGFFLWLVATVAPRHHTIAPTLYFSQASYHNDRLEQERWGRYLSKDCKRHEQESCSKNSMLLSCSDEAFFIIISQEEKGIGVRVVEKVFTQTSTPLRFKQRGSGNISKRVGRFATFRVSSCSCGSARYHFLFR